MLTSTPVRICRVLAILSASAMFAAGAAAQKPGDPCFGIGCGSNGQCVIDAGVGRCECDPGYEFDGRRCWKLPEPCLGVTCSGHGQCVAFATHAECQCDPGFEPLGTQCVPAAQCTAPPPGGPGCPESCTGGCVDGVCVIDCNGLSDCQGHVLACPEGMPCRTECGGISSCQHAQFQCAADAPCDIQCTNTSSCQGSYVTCGAGACSVSCSGSPSKVSSIQCGTSCSCESSCEQGDPCDPGTDCPGDPCFGIGCGSNGQCVIEAGVGRCECDPGYEFDGRRCWKLPEPCLGVTCSGHGQCVAFETHGECACDAGFAPLGLQCVPEG